MRNVRIRTLALTPTCLEVSACLNAEFRFVCAVYLSANFLFALANLKPFALFPRRFCTATPLSAHF